MYSKTMNFKRSLLIMLAAALSAGTSAASTFVFAAYVAADSLGNQSLSVSIDAVSLFSWSGTAGGGLIYSNTLTKTDGWHTIAIDYKNISSSTNGLTLTVDGGWVAFSNLQSLGATNTPIYGLRGDYF